MKSYLLSGRPVRYARWRFILVSVIATVFIITSLVCPSACAQQASNNKTPPTSKETNKTDPAADANAQTPPPPADWLHRDKLTGDWGGARNKLEEHGFAFELEFTQFYQGTASGGLEEDDAYGGRIDATFKFDLGKLGLWKNGTIEAKAVTRYGKPVNELTGALLPANTALIVPAEEGTVTAVTTLKYTHIFPFEKPGDLFLISVGKFDTIDLVADLHATGASENHVALRGAGHAMPARDDAGRDAGARDRDVRIVLAVRHLDDEAALVRREFRRDIEPAHGRLLHRDSIAFSDCSRALPVTFSCSASASVSGAFE